MEMESYTYVRFCNNSSNRVLPWAGNQAVREDEAAILERPSQREPQVLPWTGNQAVREDELAGSSWLRHFLAPARALSVCTDLLPCPSNDSLLHGSHRPKKDHVEGYFLCAVS